MRSDMPGAIGNKDLVQQSQGCSIVIDHTDALRDSPVSCQIMSLRPGQRVILRLDVEDEVRQRWRSYAEFEATPDGGVDLTSAAPRAGSYHRVDAMGLFWSMLPVGTHDSTQTFFSWGRLTPLRYNLTVEANGVTLARAQLTRRGISERDLVIRQQVDGQPFVGTFFYPAAPGHYPVAVVLGGSEGGLDETTAALLASHGIAALSLAYFGLPSLPDELVEIPLEYFAGALAWLTQQPMVRTDRLVVMGMSKGGELALVLAATYPTLIHGVIGIVPSGLVFPGISRRSENYRAGPKSSWTLKGAPIPFANANYTFGSVGVLMRLALGRPTSLKPLYKSAMHTPQAREHGAIAVERIQGPILLVSATDDQVWPSTHLSEMIIERLAAHQFGYSATHLPYAGAGHLLFPPYMPTNSSQFGAFLAGGTPEATAAAQAAYWPHALRFVQRLAS